MHRLQQSACVSKRVGQERNLSNRPPPALERIGFAIKEVRDSRHLGNLGHLADICKSH